MLYLTWKKAVNFLGKAYNHILYIHCFTKFPINKQHLISILIEQNRLPHQSKKYFMFGSLIALSNNNFSTIYFATIEDAKDLIKGKVCNI